MAFVAALIEVDDVLDGCAAAVDDPVVSVKRCLIAEPGVEAGARGEGGGIAAEGEESGAAASGELIN